MDAAHSSDQTQVDSLAGASPPLPVSLSFIDGRSMLVCSHTLSLSSAILDGLLEDVILPQQMDSHPPPHGKPHTARTVPALPVGCGQTCGSAVWTHSWILDALMW